MMMSALGPTGGRSVRVASRCHRWVVTPVRVARRYTSESRHAQDDEFLSDVIVGH